VPPGDYNFTVTATDYVGNKATKKIYIVLNETGHHWSPIITDSYHQPTKPTEQNNIIILANITSDRPFSISTVTIHFTTNNTQKIKTHNMFAYATKPTQSRSNEDSPKK
jgi:hypothetical protein